MPVVTQLNVVTFKERSDSMCNIIIQCHEPRQVLKLQYLVHYAMFAHGQSSSLSFQVRLCVLGWSPTL